MSGFGTSNFYSRNLIDNGIKAEDLIVNCYPLQSKWAHENNVKFMKINMDLHPRLYSLPLVGSLFSKLPRTLDILIEQIKNFKPDIIYSQNISLFNYEKLMLFKKYSNFLLDKLHALYQVKII